MNEKTVLAIDPGQTKVGMALVTRTKEGATELLWRTIADRSQLGEKLQESKQVKPYQVVVVGNGTRSKEVIAELREFSAGLSILIVDEKNSSLEARARYWEHYPRRGLKRFFPASLFVPPVPLDDFAALVLAERVLAD